MLHQRHEEFAKKLSDEEHVVKVTYRKIDDMVEQCVNDRVKVG